jgi:hypothetical protein
MLRIIILNNSGRCSNSGSSKNSKSLNTVKIVIKIKMDRLISIFFSFLMIYLLSFSILYTISFLKHIVPRVSIFPFEIDDEDGVDLDKCGLSLFMRSSLKLK